MTNENKILTKVLDDTRIAYEQQARDLRAAKEQRDEALRREALMKQRVKKTEGEMEDLEEKMDRRSRSLDRRERDALEKEEELMKRARQVDQKEKEVEERARQLEEQAKQMAERERNLEGRAKVLEENGFEGEGSTAGAKDCRYCADTWEAYTEASRQLERLRGENAIIIQWCEKAQDELLRTRVTLRKMDGDYKALVDECMDLERQLQESRNECARLKERRKEEAEHAAEMKRLCLELDECQRRLADSEASVKTLTDQWEYREQDLSWQLMNARKLASDLEAQLTQEGFKQNAPKVPQLLVSPEPAPVAEPRPSLASGLLMATRPAMTLAAPSANASLQLPSHTFNSLERKRSFGERLGQTGRNFARSLSRQGLRSESP